MKQIHNIASKLLFPVTIASIQSCRRNKSTNENSLMIDRSTAGINSGSIRLFIILLGIFTLGGISALAGEYHVSMKGSDDADGRAGDPFLTISAASRVGRAGDTITVHEGIYREWVDPLYGGTSHLNRVLYRTAEGENVAIVGSEVIKGWKKLEKGVWKVSLDNSLFGDYNPYREIIEGDWFRDFGRDHHTGEVYLNGKSFYEIDSLEKLLDPLPLKGAQDQEGSLYQWYCESDSKTTTIWANFHGADPNRELVEINVRPAVFFPKKSGINYITVSGFILSQAATDWAPPTAHQTGLIGPNWSKGWIIENNTITHSKCSGITLGKERSTGQNFSSEYKIKGGHISQLEVVFAGLKNGWSKENVGSHIIRNNTISHCEKTGILGNLGAVFSQIYGNHIFDIHTKRQWGGFDMAGIKFHAPIDVLIKDNCIHNAFKGIWIDWQAQGLRITGNLFFDNSWMDLHMEVSHGPHIIDNNCFLSDLNLWNMAVGSAYVYNLFAGQVCKGVEYIRFTPYHFPHSIKVAGLMTIQGGDDRYLNNVFIKTPAPAYDVFENANRPKRKEGTMDYGLGMYDQHPTTLPESGFPVWEMSKEKLPVTAENNLYLNGAVAYKNGVNEVVDRNSEIEISIEEKEDGIYMVLKTGEDFTGLETRMINSFDFGEAVVTEAVFENPDCTAVLFLNDYLNAGRQENRNDAGPFAIFSKGENVIKLWPK
ncbi:MAG TPA: right-handed parallel beta-helix repeat-containing protein [Bacteroides sp.]|nr:right-handed parallel beta-helix repeat-containing protein [Bacteroides sp.]